MSRLTERVDSLVSRYGEDFSVGVQTRRGVFSNITTGNARAYLTFAEIDSASLPLWCCLVSASDSTVIGDTVSWNGLSLLVAKVAQARYQGNLLAKMLVFVSS